MQNNARYQVRVQVEPCYLAHESDPDQDRYVFSYTVTIRNTGQVPVRLLNRHWLITDAHGTTRTVDGEGVVGEQPHLEPGDQFRYTSGAMLTTPVGSMEGSYDMLADDGTAFQAEIAPFTLAMPRRLH
ncbi:MAG: Co2+/Mg2+ efflux protein ApaG [Ectothiorhodospiraceae bacterium]|nr:Co2+/Mg2+ efflux protein ApaG [Ectothiorhodospiraceae bacterium]